LLSFVSVAYGSNDCAMVKTQLSDHPETTLLSNIYPDAAYNQALMNLKAYCCETAVLPTK
jgi:hypothetical protein